jgi:hypothetical protein
MSRFTTHPQPCKPDCIPCATQFGYREGLRKAAMHLLKEIDEAKLAHEPCDFLETLMKRITSED